MVNAIILFIKISFGYSNINTCFSISKLVCAYSDVGNQTKPSQTYLVKTFVGLYFCTQVPFLITHCFINKNVQL